MDTTTIKSFEQQPNMAVFTPQRKVIFQPLLGSIGTASGVIYAFSKKTGFWKGLGIALIGGFVAGGIGYGIDNIMNNS